MLEKIGRITIGIGVALVSIILLQFIGEYTWGVFQAMQKYLGSGMVLLSSGGMVILGVMIIVIGLMIWTAGVDKTPKDSESIKKHLTLETKQVSFSLLDYGNKLFKVGVQLSVLHSTLLVFAELLAYIIISLFFNGQHWYDGRLLDQVIYDAIFYVLIGPIALGIIMAITGVILWFSRKIWLFSN